MARYEITGPDGAKYEVTAPDDATEAQVLEYAKQNFNASPAPRPEAVQSAGKSLADMLSAVPRQVGLTARAGLTGLGDAVGVFSNPIASAINLGFIGAGKQAPIQNASQTMTGAADWLGFPKPETPTERVAQEGARMMAGVGGFGAVGKAAKYGGDAARKIGEFLTQNLASQVSSAAGAGLTGGSVKEAGAGPGVQFGASLLGGLVGGMVPGAVSGAKDWLTRVASPKMTQQQLDVKIERLLADQGIDWQSLPNGAKFSLRTELAKSLQAGKELDPVAVGRLADFRTVGATPTRGMVTLDPVQITREKNLSKIAANSGDAELHGLPRIENANNAQLIAKTNEVAGGRPTDLYTAGDKAVKAINARDDAARAVERGLYAAAQDSQGRSLPLNRDAFVYKAYDDLAKENKGAFLPESINNLLEQIRTGKARYGGREMDTPFTVDQIDNLKTVLAAESRSTKNGNVKRALSIVRDALDKTPLDVGPGRQFGGSQLVTAQHGEAMKGAGMAAQGLASESMQAFDRARRFARSLRSWRESTPGITAAVDDATPDQFVRKFVISESAPVADVQKLAKELGRDPEVRDTLKSAIVGYLKDRALSGASDEVGKFSQSGYNRAMKSLERKLPLFFSPDEIAQLKAVGRVASYTQVQPVGSAVNNSNTGGLLAGRGLDFLTGLASKMPFGKAAIVDPIRSVQVSLGERGMQNIMPGLLAPIDRPPFAQRLAVPSVLSAGLLAAPVVD